jgi:hypothetical protein
MRVLLASSIRRRNGRRGVDGAASAVIAAYMAALDRMLKPYDGIGLPLDGDALGDLAARHEEMFATALVIASRRRGAPLPWDAAASLSQTLHTVLMMRLRSVVDLDRH